MRRWRRGRRTDEDFRDEVLAHVDLETGRLIAEGMSRDRARAAALRAFGSPRRVREQFHEANRWMLLEHLLIDLRYAWRSLWKSRIVAATLALTLGVALSLLTIVFAVFNAYVLRPFAVHDPHALVAIGWQSPESSGRSFRWADYEDIRTRTDLFDAVVAEDARLVSSDGRMLSVGFVSGNYFDALRPRVRLGRVLQPADGERVAGPPVVVLTDQGWDRLFGRDPAAVGRQVRLNDQVFTIAGVTRREFSGLDDSPRDAWVPVSAYRSVVGHDPFTGSAPRAFDITARLRNGVTAGQVQGILTLAPFEASTPGRVDAVRPTVVSRATPSSMSVETAVLLAPVVAAFALVLLTACANASNVMLARAHARHREIGVRLAIGASRNRIVRQLLTEALLVSLLAGLVGLGLASLALRAGPDLVVAAMPPSVAGLLRWIPLDFDGRVFLFALACAGLTTILFALLPALQGTRLSLTHALRGDVSGSITSARLRRALVALQVAVSLALLVCALTLVRNARAITTIDLGFRTDRVTSINTRGDVPGAAAAAARALAADPQVEAVGGASRNPLFGNGPRAVHEPPDGGQITLLSITYASPEYFAILDIPILRGRGFLPEEGRHEARVAIVSVNAAARLWPDGDPVGQTLRLTLPASISRVAERVQLRRPRDAEPSTAVTVIGVAQDIVGEFIYVGEDTGRVYFPISLDSPRAEALLVRTRPSSDPVQPALDRILQGVHHDPLTFESVPLRDMVAIQLFPLRMASWIGSLLGAIALVLSVTGLHGVLTYTVGQRTREIGIRMALGATAQAVVRLVMRQSARMAGVGAMTGALFAWIVLRVLASLVPLRNVAFVDGIAFAASAAVMAIAAGIASYGPARRATRLDPAETLRAEG